MADAEKLANYNRILGAACEQGTLVRRTWYSEIYKVMLKIGQNQRYWNVECISIPFDDDRKNFILKKCGFSEEALPNFELAVRESMKNAYVLSKSFIRDSSQEQKDRKDFPVLPYGLLGCEESEERFEMKVVYECTERLLDCIAPGREISAIELLNQLGKINGVLKRMHRAGVCAGVVDMDQIYRLSYRIESSSGECAERTAVFPGNLLYCRKNDGEFLVPPLFPYCNIPESVKRGEKPTRESDYSSFAMLIISLLNGTYGTSRPDTIHLPEFLTQSDGYRGELIESLLNMRNSGRTQDPGRLANEFFNTIKRVIMDSEAKNITIHINTAPIYPGIKGEAAPDTAVCEQEEEKLGTSAAEEETPVKDSDRGEPAADQEEQCDKAQKEIPGSESVTQKGSGRPAESKNREEDPPDVRTCSKPPGETKQGPAEKAPEYADEHDASEEPSAGRTAKKTNTDELIRLKSKNAVRGEITALKRKETDDTRQKTAEKREQPKKTQSHGLLTRLFGGTEEKKKESPKKGRVKAAPATKKEDSAKKVKKRSSAPKNETEPDDPGPVFEFFEVEE